MSVRKRCTLNSCRGAILYDSSDGSMVVVINVSRISRERSKNSVRVKYEFFFSEGAVLPRAFRTDVRPRVSTKRLMIRSIAQVLALGIKTGAEP
jgi:hypothetical protein